MVSVRSVLIRMALFGTSLLLTLLALEALLRLSPLQNKGTRSTAVKSRATSKMHEPDFRRPGFAVQLFLRLQPVA